MTCKSFGVRKGKKLLWVHWHEENGHPVLLRKAELVYDGEDPVMDLTNIDISMCNEGDPHAAL